MITKITMDGFSDERGYLFWTSPKLLDFDYKYLTIGTLEPGYSRGGHYHRRIVEKLLVVCGEMTYIQDDEKEKVFPGEVVDIPHGCKHTITNIGEKTLVFVEFKSEEFNEEDKDTYV